MSKLKLNIYYAVVITMILISAGVIANITLKAPSGTTAGYFEDNLYIKNSNGKLWTVTEANLRTAIWDLNNASGTVTVGDNITISSSIVLGCYTTLDFCFKNVTVSADCNVFQMKPGSKLCNAYIDISGVGGFSDTSSVVLFDGGDHFELKDEACIVENIHINSAGDRGIGIHYSCPDNGDYVVFTQIDNIWTERMEYGILINVSASGGNAFVNSNSITGFHDTYSRYGIYMEYYGGNEVVGNIFTNIQIEMDNGAYNCDTGIWCNGTGNMFLGVMVSDIHASDLGFNLTSDGNHNVMIGYAQLWASGGNNVVFNAPKSPIHLGRYIKPKFSEVVTEPNLPEDSYGFWINDTTNIPYIVFDYNNVQTKIALSNTGHLPTVNATAPEDGFCWFDTATNKLIVYNGTNWVSTTLS